MVKSVVIFGATGATGRHLVKFALNEGYSVRVFVRNLEKLKEQLGNFVNDVEIVQGNITNKESVINAIEGMDNVISVVGGPHSSRKYPRGMMLKFVKAVVEGCRTHGCYRFLYQAGGFSPTPDSPLTTKVKIMRTVFAPLMGISPMLQDNDAVIKYLFEEAPDLDWIVTRPGMLKEGKSRGDVNNSEKLPNGSVNFVDLAKYTLVTLENEANVHKCPYPAYA